MRAAATTAVVAGTAGAVRHHQNQKYAQQDYQQQQMYADQAAAAAPAEPQVVYVQAPPAPAPAPVPAAAPDSDGAVTAVGAVAHRRGVERRGVCRSQAKAVGGLTLDRSQDENHAQTFEVSQTSKVSQCRLERKGHQK